MALLPQYAQLRISVLFMFLLYSNSGHVISCETVAAVTPSVNRTFEGTSWPVFTSGGNVGMPSAPFNSTPPSSVTRDSPRRGETSTPRMTQTTPVPPSTYFIFETTDDVKQFVDTDNATRAYIGSFDNDLQRTMIQKQLGECPLVALCHHKLAGIEFEKGIQTCCQACSCDVMSCTHESTCCPDILDMNLKLPIQDTMCIPDHLSYNVYAVLRGFDAIAKCSMTASSLKGASLSDKCVRPYTTDIKHVSDVVPCVSKVTSKIYRNKYCALCNEEQKDDLEYFDIKFSIRVALDTYSMSEQEMIERVLNNANYSLEFVGPGYMEIDKCNGRIDSCNVTGMWGSSDPDVTRACGLYTSQIYQGGLRFKNAFCAECNGIEITDINCIQYEEESAKEIIGSGLYAFSALLSIGDDDGGETIHNPNGDQCGPIQFYDVLQDTCRDVVCAEMQMLKDDRCEQAFAQMSSDIIYSAYVRIVPLHNVTLAQMHDLHATHQIQHQVLHRLSHVFESHLCSVQRVYVMDSVDESRHDSDKLPGSRCLYLDVRLQLLVKANSQCSPVTKFINDLQNLHNRVISIDGESDGSDIPLTIKVFENNKFEVPSMDEILGEDGLGVAMSNEWSKDSKESLNSVPTDLSSEYLLRYAKTVMDAAGRTRIPDDRPMALNKPCVNLEDTQDDTPASISLLTMDTCRKIRITRPDIPWHQTDDASVLIGRRAFVVDSNKYFVVNETTIAMCIYTFEQYVAFVMMDRHVVKLTAKTVVSYICSAISILSLTITIATFGIFPKLRQTIPGKNNMTLATMLLFANTMFIVSSVGGIDSNSLLCMIIGCVVHTCWLLSLLWMNVCTYHMCRVLTTTKAMSVGSGWRKYLLYHVYATTMTAVCVVTNMATSEMTSGAIGYGGNTCYITSATMILYTFALPIALVVLANMAMFCLVIRAIRRSATVQKNVKNERNDLVIFAKLSTLTGITWAVGLTNIWTGNEVLEYLFIVLNGGQGLLIFLAFVVNRQVAELYKKALFGKGVKSSESAYVSSVTSQTST